MADKADKVSAKVVDFSNVKEGGGTFNKRRIPSGDYAAKIIKVQDAQSKGDGEFQYLFTIQPQKFSDRKFPYYCKLQENQLWKLRNILIAAGISVPKKRVKLDPSKTIGKLIGITVEDDEYEGKAQSTISAVFPASELADGQLADDEDEGAEDVDDSDEEDLDDTEDDSEDDEAEGGDEFDDMDRAALKAYLKTADPSFQAKKSQSDDDLRELARAAGAGSDDEDDEDEEEAEPEPPKKKAKKKAAPVVDDDEMEELDISDL